MRIPTVLTVLLSVQALACAGEAGFAASTKGSAAK